MIKWALDSSCLWPPSEVVREVRNKEKGATEDYIVQEKADWVSLAASYFHDKSGESLAQKKRRVRKEYKVAPRIASLDAIRVTNNALYAGTGVGMDAFYNAPELQDLEERFVETRRYDFNELPPPPKTLVLTGDEAPVQLCGWYFLRNKLELNIELVNDPFHRSFNDAKLAIRRAGFWGTFQGSLLHMNIAYGPWQNSSWFAQLCEEAGHISQRAGENDPVLLHFWDDLLLDDPTAMDICDNNNGRKHFLDTLLGREPFTTKGPKCSASRWWSWCEALCLRLLRDKACAQQAGDSGNNLVWGCGVSFQFGCPQTSEGSFRWAEAWPVGLGLS